MHSTGTVVAETQDVRSFENLLSNNDYKIKVTYTYDLNDGLGERTASFEKNVKTAPVVNVTDCKIANTSAVSEGETIYLQATLDNPLGLKIKSVTVNSTSYNVTSLSSSDRIFI